MTSRQQRIATARAVRHGWTPHFSAMRHPHEAGSHQGAGLQFATVQHVHCGPATICFKLPQQSAASVSPQVALRMHSRHILLANYWQVWNLIHAMEGKRWLQLQEGRISSRTRASSWVAHNIMRCSCALLNKHACPIKRACSCCLHSPPTVVLGNLSGACSSRPGVVMPKQRWSTSVNCCQLRSYNESHAVVMPENVMGSTSLINT